MLLLVFLPVKELQNQPIKKLDTNNSDLEMATFKACIGRDGVLHDIEVQIIAWPIDLFQNYF